MVAVFGKSFTEFCKPRFDISESLLRETFTYPDNEQNLFLQGLKIRLYLKKMNEKKKCAEESERLRKKSIFVTSHSINSLEMNIIN